MIELKFPSIVADMSNADYHGNTPGFSSSQLKVLANQTPAHFRAKYIDGHKDAVSEETQANFDTGSGIHTLALEPEKFHSEFAVMPKFDRRTKQGKADHAAWMDDHGDKTPLTPAQYGTAKASAEALRQMPSLKGVLERTHMVENSLFWVDRETGIQLKCRPDLLSPALACFDVKSTKDASPGEFDRSVYNFGYHFSAAMYLDGITQVTGEPLSHFVFLCVEKTAPYCTAAYALDEDAMALGRKQYRRALETLAECQAKDAWPGYAEQITPISLPAWAFRKAA